jgi:methionine synthase II (cobalamin-independent)
MTERLLTTVVGSYPQPEWLVDRKSDLSALQVVEAVAIVREAVLVRTDARS